MKRTPALVLVLCAAAIAVGAAFGATPKSSFSGTATTPTSSFSGSGSTGGGEGDDGNEGDDEGHGSTFQITPAQVGATSLSASAVRSVQKALARLGYFHHAVTGFYGPVTTTAVQQFQRAVGLKADGIWGPRCQSALKRRLASKG